MYTDMDGSIYAMLDAGMTIEEIKEEVERIAAEHEAEEKEQEREDARSNLAYSFCEYLAALDLIEVDAQEWDDTFDTVEKYFKEFEENILAFNSIMNKSKKEKGGGSSVGDTTAKFDEELRRLVKILSNIEK